MQSHEQGSRETNNLLVATKENCHFRNSFRIWTTLKVHLKGHSVSLQLRKYSLQFLIRSGSFLHFTGTNAKRRFIAIHHASTELKNDCACVTGDQVGGQSRSRLPSRRDIWRENIDLNNTFRMKDPRVS